jgi:glycosyltransferase involved in cell wall biosynthesis
MRTLMLVSAFVGSQLRADVAARERPRPEFLDLEERHAVSLFDWAALGVRPGTRSVGRSLHHALRARARAHDTDAILSDGEHVAIPLSLAMSMGGTRPGHVAIAHNLLTPPKLRALRSLKAYRCIDRVVVHSPNQVTLLAQALPEVASRLRVVPYGIDTAFWGSAARGTPAEEVPNLVVSAGREHRDYETLLAARPPEAHLFIADHSAYSPNAQRTTPDVWPPGVERAALSPLQLRDRYQRAAIVVVPVIETPFPAGITTVLEAMSMGKALIVTGTSGLAGIVDNGRTGVVVPPGDREALRRAISDLLADSGRRAALGESARCEAVRRFGLKAYVDALATQLCEVA